MQIGIPRESRPGETLVAATARTVTQLTTLGYQVLVESGAGSGSDQADADYVQAGARVAATADVWASSIVAKVNAPTDGEIARLRPGATVVAMMAPGRSPELVDTLADAGVTALAMDAVPRISRAQSLDVLSSLANVAGYRAVVEAAHEFGRMFTGQVTAAGKIPPARVFVVGAGVAGLAAIGAAASMGAVVRAFDVRPEVAEQVESMGARFVTVDITADVSTDGYAKEMTAEQERATAAMYDEEARAADIVITTALIPGRPAPRLISAQTIAGMRRGAVIVDLAAATGGNAALSVADEKVVTANGVTILGYTDLSSRLAAQTSQLYGTNVVNLFKLLTPHADGQLRIDLDDVVQRSMTVVQAGAILWPPPPVQVSATPQRSVPSVPPGAGKAAAAAKRQLSGRARLALIGTSILALFVVTATAPPPIPQHFSMLVLSVVVGFYVIGHVAHALHTPLMSVTNAISGIIVVGALAQIAIDDPLIRVLSFVAILLASINILGGFSVTRRMLNMFRKS